MAMRSAGASKQASSSTAERRVFAVWAAHTGTARTRRRGLRRRIASTAALAVTPVARPSSTRIAVRPPTSGSGRSPRKSTRRRPISSVSFLAIRSMYPSEIPNSRTASSFRTRTPPWATAPIPNSSRPGAPSLRAIKTSRGAPKEREISYATGTPPRGRARTTGSSSRYPDSLSASLRPASSLSLNKRPPSITNSMPSTLDHDQGPEAGNLLAYPRPVRRVDDLGGVLVSLGHLLVYGGPVGGADQDALILQLPPDVAPLGRLLRLFAAHLAPCPVGAGAEGLAHGPFGARQDEGVAAHVPRHQDRLSHGAVGLGQLPVSGAEGACGALAVNQELSPVVLLELGVVVREIVENPQAVLLRVESHLP